MIEAGAREVTEKQIIDGVVFAQKESKAVLKLIEDLNKEVGKEREVYKEETPSAELESAVKKLVGNQIEGVIKSMVAQEGGRSTELQELIDAVIAKVADTEAKWVPEIIDHIKKITFVSKFLKGN